MLKRPVRQKRLVFPSAVWSILFILLIFIPQAFGVPSDLHSEWNELLKKHVHDGLVDYAGVQQDRELLNRYLTRLEAFSIEGFADFSREDRIAFWLNLYNASVIRLVLDEYPIQRFDQIPAVFDIRTVRAVGEFFSLAELRDNILRSFFRDERILTAMVSARMDSPRLLGEAFQGDRLEEQLDRAAVAFVEDETRNRIVPEQKKVFLSPVFHEFQNDFILNFRPTGEPSKFSDSEAAVIGFVLEHLQDPKKRLFLNSGRYKVLFLAENPVLNDVRSLSSEPAVLN